MASPTSSQGRALVITLPALTLITHSVLVVVLAPHMSPPALSEDASHPTSWFSLYNVFAAGASLMGLIGIVRFYPALVSAYTIVHTITLLVSTLALLNIFLPFDVKTVVPIIPRWKFDEKKICREIDDGFGWDKKWFERCTISFAMVKLGVAWGGLVLMAVQWWALVIVWRWGRRLREDGKSDKHIDVEKAGFMDMEEEPNTTQESRA